MIDSTNGSDTDLIKVGEDWERVYEEYSYHFYKNLNNNKKGR